jgi:hypothetical protein
MMMCTLKAVSDTVYDCMYFLHDTFLFSIQFHAHDDEIPCFCAA